MFTTDFSRAPLQGRAGAVVLAEGRASGARARDGVTWRRRLRDARIRFELLTVETVEQADAIARAHESAGLGRALVLVAEPRGYTNGVWRAEEQAPMAHNERFHPVSSEERAGETPPRIGGRIRRPRARSGGDRASRPRTATVFDTGSMFLGATRYRHPLAWLVTSRYWFTMVDKMHRMSGTVWHGVYWQLPWTLGTLATYRTRDDMLRFARMPEHRHLMQWIVRDTRNGNGGFIRIYSSRTELERQATGGSPAGAGAEPGGPEAGSGEGGGQAGSGADARAGGGAPQTALRLERVRTETDLAEFLAAPLRGGRRRTEAVVPLLEDSVRAWWRRGSPNGEPVDLCIARRGDRVVGRTTIHRDPRLDAKLGTRATLFGATWAESGDDLRELLGLIEAEAARDGSAEVFGPVALLPNQTGGVITSGFEQRGFMDSPWNEAWVPAAFESAGFERWYEGDTWIARLGDDATAMPQAPGAADLERAGIRIRRASRLRFGRDVRELRRLTNAAFAQLPYYTEISPREMRAATSGLVALMDPSLWLFAVDRASGRPVAFVLAVPDVTPVLQGSGGRIGARELWAILRGRMARPAAGADERDAILIIHGAEPAAQGRGIVSLLWRRLAANLRAGGYGAIRTTSIGRDNPASARPVQRLGGEPLHGHTYYRKRVAP